MFQFFKILGAFLVGVPLMLISSLLVLALGGVAIAFVLGAVGLVIGAIVPIIVIGSALALCVLGLLAFAS